MTDARNRHSVPLARMAVEFDPAWADDFSVDCFECGRTVRLVEGVLLPGSKYGDPEGDPPDCILVIHKECPSA